jgi:uncharacterized protein
MDMFSFSRLAAAGLCVVVFTAALPAQGKKSDSVVKVAADADKPDAEGNQVITLTLQVDKGWHIYANPIDNKDLLNAQTVVTVKGAKAPKDVKIAYPAGKLEKDTILGDYKVYEDKVIIKAHVQRDPGDAGPLEVGVAFQSCNDKQCLLPATVKLTVK